MPEETTSIISLLKLVLEILVYITAMISTIIGVYFGSPKVKNILEKNKEIKYKKVCYLKRYRFTMFLLNILGFLIFWLLSYALYFLFRTLYKYIGKNNIILFFIFIYFILGLFTKDILLEININYWLEKYGFKRKKKIAIVEVFMFILDLTLIPIFYITLFVRGNNDNLILEIYNNILQLTFIIPLSIYSIMYLFIILSKTKVNVRYNDISSIVIYINSSKYYNHNYVDVFHTKIMEDVTSDKIILNAQEKSKTKFSNYSIMTHQDCMCIINNSKIVRKIKKEDIVFIDLINAKGVPKLRISNKDIWNYSISYNDKVIKHKRKKLL